MVRIALFCSVGTLDVGTPVSMLKTAELLASEYDVAVVLPEDGAFARALAERGIESVIIPFQRLRRLRRLSQLFLYPWSVLTGGVRFLRWLKRSSVEIAHFSDLIDAPYMIFARLAGVQVVSHLRCIVPSPFWCRLYRVWNRWTADAVICVSQATQEAMFPEGSTQSQVIYDPGPAQAFLGNSTEPQDAGKELRILAVGKFLEDKGHANLIELAQLLHLKGIRFHVTIIGKALDGHERYYQTCQDLLTRYALKDHFTIIPELPPEGVAREMDRSDILAHLPNYQDPFPGVVLEAMARARVVVAYDSGGVREEFESGVSGFLIPHGDLEKAREVLLNLASDADLTRRVGRAAREYVTRRFNFQRYHNELQQLYAELLRGKSDR